MANKKSSATVPKTMLCMRIPVTLMKRLDAAATKQKRSRSAEAELRLEASLKPGATGGVQ